MDKKTIIMIISMVSVLLMLILYFVGVKNAWIVVFAGGIAIVIVDRLYHGKAKDVAPGEQKAENKPEEGKKEQQ